MITSLSFIRDCLMKSVDFNVIAEKVGHLLQEKKWLLASAESCTGGWVASVVTSIAGSSAWFERGFVTYSNRAKEEMLGVSSDILHRYGAVSEQTAQAMAEGAIRHSHASISLAVTGIAGPDGGTADKPVGTVCFAWAGESIDVVTQRQHFCGSRHNIRAQSVIYALTHLIKILE